MVRLYGAVILAQSFFTYASATTEDIKVKRTVAMGYGIMFALSWGILQTVPNTRFVIMSSVIFGSMSLWYLALSTLISDEKADEKTSDK